MDGINSRRRGRSSYFWNQAAFAGFVVVYLGIVFERERVMGRGEIFPIASWSLFSKVPSVVTDYSLVIREIDGCVMSPSFFWEESSHYFAAAVHHAGFVVIDRVGLALASGDEALAEELRHKFELVHMREAERVRYDLVRRTYDPLVRWKSGAFERVATVAEYSKEGR